MIKLLHEKLNHICCRHLWKRELILSMGLYTHHDIKTCIKCGKSITLFSGSRETYFNIAKDRIND
jgi:hypothetical protein